MTPPGDDSEAPEWGGTRSRGPGAAAHEVEGLRFESQGRLADAAAAFGRALALDPLRQASAEAQARLALQLGSNDAVGLCLRAIAFHRADQELHLHMVAASAALLGTAALPLYEDYLAYHPGDARALEQAAELKAECGDPAALCAMFEVALAAEPMREDLYLVYARTLWRGQNHAEALAVLGRARRGLGASSALDLLEAQVALDCGQSERAEARLQGLEGPDALRTRAQFLLRSQRGDEASSLLAALVADRPADASLWAMLSIAWRLTADPRHEWLCTQPGLWRSLPLHLTTDELAATAEALGRFHTARAQPIGQSVRGGTQTPGSLFARVDPALARLREALAEAVREYIEGLPAFDPAHPLLRHRKSRLVLGPSWSVRLNAGGYHAPHVHPAGVLSSACYISVPAELVNSPTEEGWLEIGRPARELGLDLEPIATVKPEPGTLALFPSYLFHGTRPFGMGERLTVAFDVIAA